MSLDYEMGKPAPDTTQYLKEKGNGSMDRGVLEIYDDGYGDGYNDGHDDGYGDGFDDGEKYGIKETRQKDLLIGGGILATVAVVGIGIKNKDKIQNTLSDVKDKASDVKDKAITKFNNVKNKIKKEKNNSKEIEEETPVIDLTDSTDIETQNVDE